MVDHVVSLSHADGLVGYPNEIKLKYVSDNKFDDLMGGVKGSNQKEIREKMLI